MHLIELLIHQWQQEVNKGSWKAPQPLVDKFGADTVRHLKKQFERELNREFTIYASNIGKPICQLLLDQQGIKGVSETNAIRNLFGDLVEDVLLFALYAAGVPIVSEQETVSLELAGVSVRGRLDVVIDFGNDPRVWDIKSAADWSFKNKFNVPFEKFIEQDYFGYADQLFLYSAARGCKAGGWIVKNKSSGEIRIIEAPEEQRLFRDLALKRMENKVNLLLQRVDQSLERFNPTQETFKKKLTGNLVAHEACTFCDKKFHCWPNIQLKPRAKSEAKNPPLIWYIEYKE